MSQQAAIEQLKNDVAQALLESPEVQGGFNPDKLRVPVGAPVGSALDVIRNGLSRFDDALAKFGPILTTVTPSQYKALVIAVVALVQAADGALNGTDGPAPVRASAPADPQAEVDTAVHQG